MNSLNFKTYGSGPPLIILHGLFGMLDNWQKFGKTLADQYSIFLIDQRNHGKSFHDDEMNYAAMAEDLRLFMEANYMYEAHVLGHSMGGKTAMEFALQNEDMVTKLVVVDIAPKKYTPHHQSVFDALNAVPIDEVDSRGAVNEILEVHLSDMGTRQFLQKNLYRKKEGGYQWKMNLPAITAHYDDILNDVTSQYIYDGPTLFVGGGNSKYIQPEDHTLIHTRFPNAKIKIIEESGHWVHVDAFGELLAMANQFLAD